LSRRSQFFRSRRFLSCRTKLHLTIQRLDMNPLLLAICRGGQRRPSRPAHHGNHDAIMDEACIRTGVQAALLTRSMRRKALSFVIFYQPAD
jgi:hypothetical protein